MLKDKVGVFLRLRITLHEALCKRALLPASIAAVGSCSTALLLPVASKIGIKGLILQNNALYRAENADCLYCLWV